MTISNIGKAGLVTGLAVASAGCSSVQKKTEKQPNLVFVFPDQMRGSAMGFLYEEPVITPNLDKFASQSAVFTDAVSNYPVCSPYRAMLMTGKYPFKNKVLSNCTSRTEPYNCELQQSDRCWSDVLKDNGYSLGYIGKWHLDSPQKPYIKCANNHPNFAWNEWCPPERRHGFDYWYSYGTYDWHMRPMYWNTNAGRHDFKYVDQWGPEHEADKAVAYIKNESGKLRDNSKPFAMVVSMNPPHMPYDQFPKRYLKHYDDKTLADLCKDFPQIPPKGSKWGDYYRKNIRNYYAMITGVDAQFGRILKALEEQGLDENTIVVFCSDHGDCLGRHDFISKNNHKEESMRVPFIIRYPKKLQPKHDDLLISVPDVYPTLLGLMGLDKEIPAEVEGKDYSELILTGKGERPTSQLYMKVPFSNTKTGQRGIRNHRYTLVFDKQKDGEIVTTLHDNKKDPHQLKNIAAENKELVEKLKKVELEPALREIGDPWLQ